MAQKSSLNNRPLEIRWHGRGGQGAITAAKIIAQAAFVKGYRGVTAAPSFGAERRGAPVSASTRISSEPILVVSQVENPDIVVVLDHTLLKYPDVFQGLGAKGWMIINSPLSPRELGVKGEFNVATADATKVCQDLGLIVAGLVIVNTAILGALLRATKIVDLPTLEKVIRERFSKNTVDINLSAINKTYEITKLAK
ncbi:MAG: 2-oxoacid:acceptor oxidoreductase family protein [Dehalococcoidia bacterium]|jgi:2-oxoacid:acceptor oxidoreductase gamma subunit (pyruvate/2-ketoisovalerate family)